MESQIRTFHHVVWDSLSITEISLSNNIAPEELTSANFDEDENRYTRINAQFLDYGAHNQKYVWGDGIHCMWDNTNQRTCYFPWENLCDAWNAAKLDFPASINKIVIRSSNNHARNLGLKIQVSNDRYTWKTIYILNRFDIQKMTRSSLSIYFSDDTKYLYVRVLHDNSFLGYDIDYIKVYSSISPRTQNTQNSLFYVLNGTMTVEGFRYRAPFGFVKLKSSNLSVAQVSTENAKIFRISFRGEDVVRLLEEANYDLNNPIFEIKSQSYFNELNRLIDDWIKSENDENQFEIISKFMSLLAMHFSHKKIKADVPSTCDEYVIKAMQYLEEHQYKNILLSDLAKHCMISEKYLIKVFKSRVGKTPIQYLNHCKIHLSKTNLTKSQKSIAEISQELGFSSAEYFCRTFKQIEGISPSRYRAEFKKQHAK